jgi:hypothetical protein
VSGVRVFEAEAGVTIAPSKEVVVEDLLRDLEENGIDRSEIIRTLVEALADELVPLFQVWARL